MHKLTRLKSAIISGVVALSTLAAPLATSVTPSLTVNAADGDNYAKLLQYSLYLYDANMCGDDVNGNCGFSWRSNCHTRDEVVGGFHDAGDHVMFGQPQGYTASTLGWAYYEFSDAFISTGQDAHLKLITDKFAKFFRDATVLNGDNVSKVLIEKGEGVQDHNYWGAPEAQGDRGRMVWTTGGAANITAQYAAALAANYVNFKNPDDLKYAKALYNFSKQNTGTYSISPFYVSGTSGSADELAWAAGWLYKATNDQQYLNDLGNCPEGWWVHCWENVGLGASILKAEATGDWSKVHELGSGDGYKFYDEWGSARHNCTEQLATLVAAKYNKADAGWAKGQMQYITGDRAFQNGQSYCLVVGFKSNSSKNPHHRASSPDANADERNDGTPNKYLLVGALCGGPKDASGSGYRDVRSDYQANEVAIDYNAGLVGAAAGLYHFYKTGSIDTNIEGVSKVYGGGSQQQITTTTTTYNNPWQETTTTTQNNPWQQNTTTTTVYNPSSGGGKTLLPSDMDVGQQEGDDRAIINYAEFNPQGAKKATLYFKINTSDTQASGGFGTWTGKWEQVDFENVQADSNKMVAVDYTIPSNVGQTVKAMIWWPQGDGVTIEKVVLDGEGGGQQAQTQPTTTTQKIVTTTTTTVWVQPTTTTTQDQGFEIMLDRQQINVGEKATLTFTKGANLIPFGNMIFDMDYVTVDKASDNTYIITGDAPGTTKVGFRSPTGERKTVDLTITGVVTQPTTQQDQSFEISIDKQQIAVGEKATLTFTKGADLIPLGNMIFDMDYVTVEKASYNTYTITGDAAGTTKVGFRSPSGERKTVDLTITGGNSSQGSDVQPTKLGDANCDGSIDMADAVLIMQAISNPNKYGRQGSDPNHITDIGWANADTNQTNKGVTSADALAIQKYLLGKIFNFPTY